MIIKFRGVPDPELSQFSKDALAKAGEFKEIGRAWCRERV